MPAATLCEIDNLRIAFEAHDGTLTEAGARHFPDACEGRAAGYRRRVGVREIADRTRIARVTAFIGALVCRRHAPR